MFKLVHLKKIEYTNAEDLSDMCVFSKDRCRLSDMVVFKEILHYGLIDCSIEDGVENNQKMFTTTISFKSCDKDLSIGRGLAFRLTQINGKQLLVGTKLRPFPTVKGNNPFPEKPTSSYLKTFTITWKSVVPPLLIED